MPEAKSRASTRPTDRPRVAASRAAPRPDHPAADRPGRRARGRPAPRARPRADCGDRATDLMAASSRRRRCPVRTGSSPQSTSTQSSVRATAFCHWRVAGRRAARRPTAAPSACRLVPVLAQLVGVLPEADREAGRVRRAERRGLGDDRPADRDAEDVGLDLHAQLVGGDAAVDLEHLEVDAGVLLHRLGDVAALVADRLQRGPGQVGVGVEAGQPDDRAAGVGAPVRREQAGERGHEVDAAVVLDLPGERLALGRAGDDAELVAQPLHGRAGHRDRALQRVDRRARRRTGSRPW